MFLVYDVTCQASFESIDSWLREAAKYVKGHPEVFLVANKVKQFKQNKNHISFMLSSHHLKSVFYGLFVCFYYDY